jgi:hypothetical protein
MLDKPNFFVSLVSQAKKAKRKDNKMLVTVKLNDNSTIKPVFEPAPGRAEALIEFYKNQYHTFQIQGYKIENQAGVIWTEGTL